MLKLCVSTMTIMKDETKKIFTFSDPRQERIYKKLQELGQVPAGFFRDACEMWEEEPPKQSKTNLISHCMREVIGAVIDYILPSNFTVEEKENNDKLIKKKVDKILKDNKIHSKCDVAKLIRFAIYEKEKTTAESHKKKVQAILEAYGIDPDGEIGKLWLRTTNKQDDIAIYNFVHRNYMGLPANKNKAFMELWESVQVILDGILNVMEGNYLDFLSNADQLLKVSKPKSADIKLLKEKIPNTPVTYNYFFGQLESPSWLTPLNKSGFFNSPPSAFEHPEGGISYPFWSQCEYLKKMAKVPEKQSEVLSICLEVETNNMRVRNDLLEIALLLPVEMSAQIADKIDEIDYFLTPGNYGKLIAYLSTNKRIVEAVALARKVLAFVPDSRTPPEIDGEIWHYDPVPIIRDYDYQEIIEKNFSEFVDAAGIEALKILFDQIESFNNLKYADRKSVSHSDYSEIWCPAIEAHPQKYGNDVRDSLVSGMRDLSERLITNHPDKMSILLLELESRKLSIFRRLKLHLLRKFHRGLEKKIVSELLNDEEFGEENHITHEYFLLAQEQSSLLSSNEQKRLLKIIKDGGEHDKETFEKLCRQRGIEPTEEVAKKHKMVWQSYHLSPFKKLEPDLKNFYETLVGEVGEPESPDLRIRSSGGTWGYESSISDKEFKDKAPEAIVEILKNFKPKDRTKQPFGESREGTGRSLTTHIAEDPGKWLGTITSFSELDPTFTRSMLTGYREAIKQNKKFDWKPIIELGLEILKKPIEITKRRAFGFYGDDPNWNWCRHTLVELIDDGLSSSNNQISIKQREDVWTIIESLTRDPSPTEEEAAALLENNGDPLTAAINTTRGDAIDAAIQYGIWLKSSLPEKRQKTWSIAKDAPELKAVFKEKLDVSKEPFLGIRAIFGQRLGNIAWMDIEWLKETLPVLFPDESEKKEYFNAVWEAFMAFNPPYDDLLPILSKQYKRAVKEIGQHSDNKHHLENPDEMLAQNLLQFYFRGKIELDSGLFKDFYDSASVELKGSVINFVGRNFKKEKVSEKIIGHVMTLVERRLEIIKKSSKPHEDIQEFKEFSWWVSADCFDTKWSLGILTEALKLGCDIDGDHLVLEKYLTIASTYPLEVVTTLELMVENDKKGWGVPTWGEDLRNVIQQVLNSKNDEAITKAKEFIQRLVAKGNPQYKDLLHRG